MEGGTQDEASSKIDTDSRLEEEDYRYQYRYRYTIDDTTYEIPLQPYIHRTKLKAATGTVPGNLR